MEYADEILLMDRGKLAAAGKAEALFLSGEIQRVFAVEARKTADGKFIFSSNKDEI